MPFMLNSCAGTSKITETGNIPKDTEWILIEIQTKPRPIIISRNSQEMRGFENIYTLRFDENRLSGIAAPNRYSAPYKLDKNQAITIQLIVATLMAPILEPKNLKENEYFIYLQNAQKWNISKGRLELHTTGKNNVKAVLIYDAIVP